MYVYIYICLCICMLHIYVTYKIWHYWIIMLCIYRVASFFSDLFFYNWVPIIHVVNKPNVHVGSILQTTKKKHKKTCNISTAKSICVSPQMITGSLIFTPGFTMTTTLTFWRGARSLVNHHRGTKNCKMKEVVAHSGKTRDHVQCHELQLNYDTMFNSILGF